MERDNFGNIEKGDWLVYLNGIEVPARSVKVSVGKWKMPEAEITFPPHKLLRRLGREDRVRATVFYLDNHRYKVDDTMDGPEFCLLFDGEITSWSYQNSAQSKYLSLHAIDYMQVLTRMYPHLVTGAKSMSQAMVNVSSGLPVNAFGGIEGTSMLYMLTKGFSPIKNPDSNKGDGTEEPNRQTGDSGGDNEEANIAEQYKDSVSAIDRPFDLVVNMFRLIHGSRFVSEDGKEFGEPSFWFEKQMDKSSMEGPSDTRSETTKTFMQDWSEKTSFTRRWAPSPIVEDIFQEKDGSFQSIRYADEELAFPLIKAVQDSERFNVLSATRNLAQALNGKPFWRIIRAIYQKFYYEIGFIPAPPIHKAQTSNRDIITGTPETLTDFTESGRKLPDDPDEIGSSDQLLMNYMTKPNMMFTVPPHFNVVWPSIVTNSSFNENFATQPTRTYIGNPHLLNRLSGGQGIGTYSKWIWTAAYPEQAERRVNKLRGPLVDKKDEQEKGKDINLPEGLASKAGETNIYDGLVEPEERTKGPVVKSDQMPRWYKFLNESGGFKEGGLLDRYTQYEHYRARYNKRQGSCAMTFNPYMVPGFPAVFIDDSISGFNYYAHVINMTHTLASKQRITNVTLRNVRTFEEVFEGMSAGEKLRKEADRDEKFDTFPVNPIEIIRDNFQKNEKARDYFKEAFWGYRDANNEDVIFDVKKLFDARIVKNGRFVREELDFSEKENNVVTVDEQGRYPEYVPKRNHMLKMFDAEKALEDVSRPVCTLDEYIDFHEDRGVRKGKVPPNHEKEGKGATYYRKILDFEVGEQRLDWQTRLERFRQLAYYKSFLRG